MPTGNTYFKALPRSDDDFDIAEEIKDGNYTSHNILVETEQGTALVTIYVPGVFGEADLVVDDIEKVVRNALTEETP